VVSVTNRLTANQVVDSASFYPDLGASVEETVDELFIAFEEEFDTEISGEDAENLTTGK
jgi:acyl carrier protein